MRASGTGLELLWNVAGWSLLGEYVTASVSSSEYASPDFHGWYVTGSWVVTGEHGPYDRKAAYARRILPQGRWGAWEFVGRYVSVDLNDGTMRAGAMDSWWAGVNWWATKRWKFGLVYGNIDLDRFAHTGNTQTFLVRLQWIYRSAPQDVAMYLPAHFLEERLDVLHEFIEQHPLGALVVSTNGELTADHLPMLLARNEGPKGTLHGHLARANPLWKSIGAGSDVLVVFGGANAYVSPSWYAEKALTGKVVPTWNYAVAHARGRIGFHDDATRLHALVSALTSHHEQRQPSPWSVDDAPASYVQAQLRAIVGFEIEILDIVGKFKASQNKSDADRAGIRSALESRHAEGSSELVRSPNGGPTESGGKR